MWRHIKINCCCCYCCLPGPPRRAIARVRGAVRCGVLSRLLLALRPCMSIISFIYLFYLFNLLMLLPFGAIPLWYSAATFLLYIIFITLLLLLLRFLFVLSIFSFFIYFFVFCESFTCVSLYRVCTYLCAYIIINIHVFVVMFVCRVASTYILRL